MRHISFAIVVSTLLFSSCAEQSSLSPEVVLSRSSIANSGLTSARLSVDALLMSGKPETDAMEITVNVQGNMQQGGHQLDLFFTTQGTGISSQQPLSWDAAGRFIVLSPNESYIHIEKLEGMPVLPLPESIIGSWFRLPSTGQETAAITPDPRYLRLQSEAVRVSKDHGIVTVNGKRMHHYDVAIDPQRLATYLASLPESEDAASLTQMLAAYEATGEIWIEEETFLLTKAVWDIRKTNDNTFSLKISMNISDAGLPVTVTAPEAAQPFPVSPFLPSADAVILQEF